MCRKKRGRQADCARRAVPFLTPALPLSKGTACILFICPVTTWPVLNAEEAIMSKAKLKEPASIWQPLVHWRHHYLLFFNCPLFIVVLVLAVNAGRRHRRHHHPRPFTLIFLWQLSLQSLRQQTNKVLSCGICFYLFSVQRHCCNFTFALPSSLFWAFSRE